MFFLLELMCEYVLFFLFQFREDLLGQSKKADDMSRVAGLDNQGIVGLQRQIMKYIGLLWVAQ
jgi:hypothetical protein